MHLEQYQVVLNVVIYHMIQTILKHSTLVIDTTDGPIGERFELNTPGMPGNTIRDSRYPGQPRQGIEIHSQTPAQSAHGGYGNLGDKSQGCIGVFDGKEVYAKLEGDIINLKNANGGQLNLVVGSKEANEFLRKTSMKTHDPAIDAAKAQMQRLPPVQLKAQEVQAQKKQEQLRIKGGPHGQATAGGADQMHSLAEFVQGKPGIESGMLLVLMMHFIMAYHMPQHIPRD